MQSRFAIQVLKSRSLWSGLVSLQFVLSGFWLSKQGGAQLPPHRAQDVRSSQLNQCSRQNYLMLLVILGQFIWEVILVVRKIAHLFALNGLCSVYWRSHPWSPLHMTFCQAFPRPHPSSIPFVLVRTVWFAQYLPHSGQVSHEHWYCSIWPAFFAHLLASPSHCLYSDSLAPADCLLWEVKSSPLYSWASELGCSQYFVMEYCARQEAPAEIITAFSGLAKEALSRFDSSLYFSVGLAVVGGCQYVFNVPSSCEFCGIQPRQTEGHCH